MHNLKIRLLDSQCVIENEYLELYLNLILNNKHLQEEPYRTQTHHILPRSFFRKNNMEIDDTSNNKVNLYYKDHILAHYYLALCATSEYKNSFANAFCFLIGRIDMIQDSSKFSSYIKDPINKSDLINSLPFYQELYEAAKFYQHELNKGGKWMNNGVKQQYVRPCDIDNFMELGYIIGKLPMSEEQRQKLKTRIPPNEGKITITNGKLNKFIQIQELDEYMAQGWYKGSCTKGRPGKSLSEEQIKKISISKKGTPAWNKGLTKETDQRILKYSLSESGKKSQFQKGHTPWNKGKLWDEPIKEKMRKPKSKKK